MKPLTRRQAWRRIICGLKKPMQIPHGLCALAARLFYDGCITSEMHWEMCIDIDTMNTGRKEYSPYFWPLNKRGHRMRIKAIEKLLSKK